MSLCLTVAGAAERAGTELDRAGLNLRGGGLEGKQLAWQCCHAFLKFTVQKPSSFLQLLIQIKQGPSGQRQHEHFSLIKFSPGVKANRSFL